MKKTIHIRLPNDLFEQLKAVSKLKKDTMTDVVVSALTIYLNSKGIK